MEEKKTFNEFETAMQVIGTVSKLQETHQAKEEIQTKFSKILKVSEEKVKDLDAVIANYTVEELEAMNDDEINQLFVVDGHELVIDLDIEESKISQFKKDFVLYMKRLDVYGKELDKSVEELEETLRDHDVEYKELIERFGSMYLIVEGQMKEILKNPKDETQKLRAETMLQSIQNAVTLAPIVEYIDQFNFENMLNDFNNRGNAIYKKHKVVLNHLGIKTDVTRLAALEELLGLSEEYLEFVNLPMFLVIRYIAYSKNATKEVEGMFVSSLALVYRALVEGTIREEDKESLATACKTIIEKAMQYKK